MATEFKGVEMKGVEIDGRKRFASIDGLVLDWEAIRAVLDSLIPTRVSNLPDNTGNGNGLIMTGDPANYFTKPGDYIRGGGGLNNTAPNNKIFAPSKQQPFGLYFIGRMESGAVGTSFPFRTTGDGATAYQIQIRCNDSNKIRVVCVNASTVTTATGIPFDTDLCISHIVGPNNTSNNQKIYHDGTTLSTTTRNQTASPVTPNSLNISVPVAEFMRLKRLLIYDWTGKNQAQVDALNLEVRDLINRDYGITF